jgi:hypothetical protein
MSNDHLHPVFQGIVDNLLNKPSEPAAPAEDPIFGELIHSYSRAEALDDGVLVDLALFSFRGQRLVDQVGIRYPIAITAPAYSEATDGIEAGAQADLIWRITQLLIAFKDAARRTDGADRLEFTFRGAVQLKAICGPGDDAAPVITLMLPGED